MKRIQEPGKLKMAFLILSGLASYLICEKLYMAYLRFSGLASYLVYLISM